MLEGSPPPPFFEFVAIIMAARTARRKLAAAARAQDAQRRKLAASGAAGGKPIAQRSPTSAPSPKSIIVAQRPPSPPSSRAVKRSLWRALRRLCGVCGQFTWRRPCGNCKYRSLNLHRLKTSLPAACPFIGAFVQGGYIFSLLHRHDIRVGIASGMFLKQIIPDRALRLELLTALYLCYWRWPTSKLLARVASASGEFLRAGPDGRADMLQRAFRDAADELRGFQVVSDVLDRSLTLMPCGEAKRLGSLWRRHLGFTRYWCSHPLMNPSSRLSGAAEFEKLLPNLRDGSLWRACVELANIQCGLTYINFDKIFENVAVWGGRRRSYSRVRCPNLT